MIINGVKVKSNNKAKIIETANSYPTLKVPLKLENNSVRKPAAREPVDMIMAFPLDKKDRFIE